MTDEARINADFSQRIVLDTNAMAWVPSPMAGVERRMLDRVGDEVARATSIVRYAPGSAFSPHDHTLGEEFLVLDGVFQDEHGDFGPGHYVRNPPGSRHTPASAAGCTIFVKLRQMRPDGSEPPVSIDTRAGAWQPVAGVPGLERQVLFAPEDGREFVAVERLAPGAQWAAREGGGEELLVLAGALTQDSAHFGPGTWIRDPGSALAALANQGSEPCLYWVKRGHLA